MNQTKISVVVPVYNLEKELPRCLDSILAQTHRELEVIVVDDGSRDGSRAVMERYAHRDLRIRTIFQENSGVTSARLRGVAEAAGDWIGFVDGDDEIAPEMYERLLENAAKYDAQISHCGYQMVFPDGRVHHFHNSGIIREQDTASAIRDLLEGTLVEPGLCNKLYRRELFRGLVMPADIRNNEDLLMNYYLFKATGKAVFDDWCPYHYIVRSTSASRAGVNEHTVYDPIRVKELILADATDELRADARRALANTCVYSYCNLVSANGEIAATACVRIRSKLTECRASIPGLPRRTRLLAELIVRAPILVRLAYPVYQRYFQNKKYD